ncbi:hypothetical protein SAMN05444363_0786 [Flavobacterium terrae]|uniref:Uncharacterized protein n=2 Tax=Flavobacterium terrae TaxID=415425 RepID=A0A1M6BIM5_9FLAO|nr:hypothetical protein SAMN05444363_0786 [Flavobacterium terrae]
MFWSFFYMSKIQALLLTLIFFTTLNTLAQETPYQLKKVFVQKDSIQIDSVSINKSFFKLQTSKGEDVDTSYYKVDFQKAELIFKNGYTPQDTLTIRYLKFPDFLTKEYMIYDKNKVVSSENGLDKLYKVSNAGVKKFTPFDGLTTSGSISRGVSIGNNQNTSVSSNLDLQIVGKLSDKVSLRASIQDSNIPLQQGGYSQKLDEFDQIFIELFSEKWSVRGGDLFLENRKSRFLNFNKKVQGIASQFTFGTPEKKTEVFASGALVRGQYAKSTFVGQEGNQGPYKLKGPNEELYILVISGSERVFVNGILLKRGENNDYVIDYNAGEITFTSLYPITSEMRISVEYQYSDRNFTRFVAYGGVNHEQEKWSLGGYVYSENDVKNQPLQQNLSTEQAQVLANAGDDQSLMVAPSAVEESFSDNKILYKKVLISGVEAFEFSTNPADVLYSVKFTFLGQNQGNYIVSSTITNGRVFKYVEPIAGVMQGSYEPVVKLIAPTKIQIATVLGKFNPNEKTLVDFEVGISNNDQNLFSDKDDKNNQGLAGKLNFKQRLFTGKWKVDAFGNYQLIQKNFKPIERLFAIEFNRDWNLLNPQGNQSLAITGFDFSLAEKSNWKYQFEKLDFSQSFSGSRHIVSGFFKNKGWLFQNDGSYMSSDGSSATSKFIRNQSYAKYHFTKNWVGGSFRHENNREKDKSTGQLSNLSQRFSEVGAFVGRGDSTKVFVELGYLNRVNDSINLGVLQRVNTSQSYYLKSKLLQNETSDLSVFVNYRNLKYKDSRGNEPSLNSRILYNDRFFNQLIQNTTVYETTSGTIPQQEFSFLEVDPGKGVYAWNDYNNNGIQEIQEFEIAAFPDQAKYVKIFLPNQIFIKTHQNKFSESITLNPSIWQNNGGVKKFLSHFYNQTSYLIERKIKRENDNFDLNPFSTKSKDLLGLNTSFRNSLFYNRGKQMHSVSYSFIYNELTSLQSSGQQEAKNVSHEMQYIYLLKKYWLFTLSDKIFTSSVSSENYFARNFKINGLQFEPKISYLFNKNASLDIFYEFKNKENTIGEKEVLKQNRFGLSFNFLSEKKFTANGEISSVNNDFTGNEFSPVGFQMLEGLQAGKNFTWRLLLQKGLTDYLDININYQGRKSELSKVIHTGNVQLRAYF